MVDSAYSCDCSEIEHTVWERKIYTLQSEGRLKFAGSLLDSLDLGVADPWVQIFALVFKNCYELGEFT